MKNQTSLIEEIQNPSFEKKLLDIYVDKSKIPAMKQRYIDTLKKHLDLFGEQEVEIYSAPGRTEICGNHTDHQHGKVLASSINLDSIAVVHPMEKGEINVYSEGYGKIIANIHDLLPSEAEYGTSVSLIRGVCAGLKEKGYNIGGFDAYITSDVDDGAGVSSSASFEVLIGNIISGLYNDMKIDPVTIAIASKYAENKFFGKPCGLMDQMACSVGGVISIDFKDNDNPVITKIDFDFEENNTGLCITNTMSSHSDLTSHYAGIPKEMKTVASYLGKEVLRECDENEFFESFEKIRKVAGDRATLRAMHFFLEENNVDNAVAALKNNDINAFFDALQKSGDSSFKNLQNIYTNNDPKEQSLALALAASQYILQGEGVTRVHGGGFAGTIQAFINVDKIESYKDQIENKFHAGICHILRIRKYGGIKVL